MSQDNDGHDTPDPDRDPGTVAPTDDAASAAGPNPGRRRRRARARAAATSTEAAVDAPEPGATTPGGDTVGAVEAAPADGHDAADHDTEPTKTDGPDAVTGGAAADETGDPDPGQPGEGDEPAGADEHADGDVIAAERGPDTASITTDTTDTGNATGDAGTEALDGPSGGEGTDPGEPAGEPPAQPGDDVPAATGEQEAAVVEPAGVEPAAVVSDPVEPGPDPVDAEPVGAEPVETGPATGGTIRTEPAVPTDPPAPAPAAADVDTTYEPLERRHYRAAALIAVPVVIVLAAAGGFLLLRHKTPTVAVTTVGPALIHAEPGGVGVTDVPIGQQVSITTGLLSITTPIQITGVDVVSGQAVRAGEPILTLDPTPLRSNVSAYASDVAAAQAALGEAQHALADAVPGTAAAVSLQSQVTADQRRVALANQAYAIAAGNSSTITSPIGGVVGAVTVTPGETVTTATTLVQILNTATLSITASIPLTDLTVVAPGDKAVVTFPDLPSVTLDGSLVSISPNSSGGGQDGTVIVNAPNAPKATIPLGVQAYVSILAPSQAPLTVPRLAISDPTTDPAVYVVTNGRVRRVPVTVGAEDDSRVQIIGGAVKAGEQVAVSGTQLLTDGEKVHPVSST